MKSNNTCPFCKILKNDTKSQIIERGNKVTAIRKLSKRSNVDFLIIPNEHTTNLKTLNDPTIMNSIVDMANKLRKNTVSGTGDYTMIINNGPNGTIRQTVFHLHAHIKSTDKEWGPQLDYRY